MINMCISVLYDDQYVHQWILYDDQYVHKCFDICHWNFFFSVISSESRLVIFLGVSTMTSSL